MIVVQSKKADYNTKISGTENKINTDHDHDKCITTQECNKLTSETFTARLKQVNLASKSDIDYKKIDLYKNELNDLSKKFKAISKKQLTKDLINNFSILNGAKSFSLGNVQIYLVFIPAKKVLGLILGSLIEFQKEKLKI